ncbi:MAG TPA: ABC transporter substrate-binding protein, partial [Candidatus Coprousia avicola]|nr:ABC transporter substrate-binding protein [Candidatus Coprousia avicola]
IDREGLARRVYRDMHLPASGIVPPRVEGYREGAWPYALNDPRQAEALLDGVLPRDEEGSRGETLSLIFAGRGGHDNAMDEIAAAWEDLGFSCELEELEEQDFRERVRTGNFQVARLDAVSDRPTTESFLFPLFHSRSAGGGNVTGFASEEVDNLLNQARAVTGDSERMSALEQADELVAADAPVIPLTYPLQVIAAGEAADGLIIDPQGYLNVEGMTAGEE